MTDAKIFGYLIASSFIVLSQGTCPSGWFGEKCQYICHCEGNCNSTGHCVQTTNCEMGWFGTKCQYKDLVHEPGTHIVIDPPQHSSWLTDGDDFTCNLNPEFHQVVVTWNRSQVFSWIRLITRDPLNLLNINVTFKSILSETSPEFQCHNQQITVSDENTMDVYCYLNVTVQQITLSNIRDLCSVYISGGRNMALKQTAVQSSLYINYSTADKAIDGNTDFYFENKSCMHTAENDSLPTWNLVFDVPVVANMFVIYNRYSNEINSNRLKHFLLLGLDEHNLTLLSFRETSDIGQLVYRVPTLNLPPLKTVQIKLDSTINPILTLCEVEMYAECAPGKWGLGCNQSCPGSCQGHCRVDNGSCNKLCAGQSDPPLCLKECVPEKWGLNCNFDCSSRCLDQVCNRITGDCSRGCLGYRDPPYCTQICRDGYWGVNCTEQCSIQCDGMICDGQTKACTHGCKSGYMMPNCTQECFDGVYGVNCSSNCSTNCVGGKCDSVLGTCFSCPNGFQGDLCDQECSLGFWGSNCSQQCSSHCIQLRCHGQTSECAYGCHDGFLVPNCTRACPSGTYGKNCQHICHCQLGSKCDPTNGECLQ